MFASAVLLTLASLLSSGCATVKIPNQEVTVDAGEFGADAYYTNTNDERHLTKEQWDKERFGQFCFKPRGLAALFAAVKSLCEEAGRCDHETEKWVEYLEKKNSRAKNRTEVYRKALAREKGIEQ